AGGLPVAESVHRPESYGSQQLPPWPGGTAGFPVAFGSSSLFSAMARDEPAQHMQSLPLPSLTGIQIRYTGERLSQRDADVFLHLLARANPVPLGEPVRFTAHSLLRDVGWDTNSRGYARLRDSISKMKANAIECEWTAGRGRRLGFAGSLIGAFACNDEVAGRSRCEWIISLEPKLLHLFDESSYTLVDLRVRRLLVNLELAKWLYAYLATHSAGSCDT